MERAWSGPRNPEGEWSRTIEIVYANRRLEEACRSDKAARQRWGPQGHTVIVRIAVICAAVTMADLVHAPGRFHSLIGNRAGTYALRVSASLRLVIAPDGEPPRKPDGGVDLARVTTARILEVTDYHEE